MKSVWDISDYKPNEIVKSNNMDELIQLQKDIWDDDKYFYDEKEARRFIKFTRKLSPDKGKKGQKLRLCVFQFQNTGTAKSGASVKLLLTLQERTAKALK